MTLQTESMPSRGLDPEADSRRERGCPQSIFPPQTFDGSPMILVQVGGYGRSECYNEDDYGEEDDTDSRRPRRRPARRGKKKKGSSSSIHVPQLSNVRRVRISMNL
eukprot:Skav200970  [mRNA]  locus=scaffold448:634484:635046:- [translate_table: standard]